MKCLRQEISYAKTCEISVSVLIEDEGKTDKNIDVNLEMDPSINKVPEKTEEVTTLPIHSITNSLKKKQNNHPTQHAITF